MKYLLLILIVFNAYSEQITPKTRELGTLTLLSAKHLSDVLNQKNRNLIKANIDSINSSLLYLSPKEQSEVLENSIYNKILNNSYIQKKALSVTTNLIKKVESKLSNSRDLYTKLSQKIIKMIVDDYRPYFEAGFLNRYQSFSRNNTAEVKKYRELLAKLKLTSHWLHLFLNTSTANFNNTVSMVIFEGFALAKEKAYYYTKFTPQSDQKNLTFNVKLGSKTPPLVKKPDTLKGAVEDIDKNILEDASKEIDNLTPNK